MLLGSEDMQASLLLMLMKLLIVLDMMIQYVHFMCALFVCALHLKWRSLWPICT